MQKSLMLPVALILGLAGCADLTPTQQRVGTGALGGAAGGALIGAMAGNAGAGALIGTAVGAGGGFLYDRSVQNRERAFQQGLQQGRSGR
jgi:uncharacterized membrane protein